MTTKQLSEQYPDQRLLLTDALRTVGYLHTSGAVLCRACAKAAQHCTASVKASDVSDESRCGWCGDRLLAVAK